MPARSCRNTTFTCMSISWSPKSISRPWPVLSLPLARSLGRACSCMCGDLELLGDRLGSWWWAGNSRIRMVRCKDGDRETSAAQVRAGGGTTPSSSVWSRGWYHAGRGAVASGSSSESPSDEDWAGDWRRGRWPYANSSNHAVRRLAWPGRLGFPVWGGPGSLAFSIVMGQEGFREDLGLSTLRWWVRDVDSRMVNRCSRESISWSLWQVLLLSKFIDLARTGTSTEDWVLRTQLGGQSRWSYLALANYCNSQS